MNAPLDAIRIAEDAAERARLETLQAMRLLDTPPETAFDDFTVLASRLCRAPIALVSLVDAERQWFKSRVGLDATETPREWAFCDHAIRGHDVFAVSDARSDPRFASNPLVTGEPGIRFYAGVPLVVEPGHAIGTLCIIDREPRELGDEDRDTLQRLGRQVVHLLELRRLAARQRDDEARQREQAAEFQRLALVAERTHNAVVIADPEGRATWVNAAFTRITGFEPHEVIGHRPGHLVQCEDTDPVARDELRRAIAARRGVRTRLLNRSKTGRRYWIEIDIAPLTDSGGRFLGFVAVQTDVTSLVTQHQQARTLLEALPVGVLVQDRDGLIVQANRAAASILGRVPDELIGQETRVANWHTVDSAGHPLPDDERPVARVLRTGKPVPPMTLGIRPAPGRQRWLRVSCVPRPGADGRPDGAITCIVDQTDEHLQRRWLEMAFSAAPISPWRWQLAEDVLDVSTGWFHRLGFTPDRPDSTSQRLAFWRVVHRDDVEMVRSALVAHEADGRSPYRAEFRVRDGHGRWRWMLSLGAATERDAAGRVLGMSGIVLDVDDRKRAEVELQRAATTDPLTGLPNRALLSDRLAQAVRAAGRHGHFGALLFIDLDHFKRINDVHGHAVGDRVLVAAGRRLAATLRAEDTLARMGGDELMVLLPHLAEDAEQATVGARQAGARLLEALAQPFTIDGVDHIIGASIGCTVFPKAPGEDAADLVREADTAMYAAKSAGRGGLRVYEAGMQQAVAASVAIERELRRALDTDELSLHLQGKWSAEGRIVGAEVLLRWQHPERGAIAPATFIPVAEDTGLIVPLGRRVLRDALALAAAQRRAGRPLPLAVNVSPRQFREPGFADEMLALLESTGAEAQDITLEITEGVLVDDVDACAERMRRLAALGMRFSIDDFGTGYSSLLYLKKLPIHELKIDRAFVRDIETDPEDAAIVRAMTAVARGFGIDVVAEGVETRAQAAFLIDAGCRLMQGWLYGRAMPVADFLAARDAACAADAGPTPAR